MALEVLDVTGEAGYTFGSTTAGHTIEVQPPTRGREGRTHHRRSTTKPWERRQDTP